MPVKTIRVNDYRNYQRAYFEFDPQLNIIAVHPGWVRTNEGNAKAPFGSYEQAETLRLLFEAKRHDKTGPIFVTHTGEEYPW